MKKEFLHFRIEGDSLTKFIRDVALEPNITKSWNILDSAIGYGQDQHLIKKVFISLLDGSKEFQGVNNLDWVPSKNTSVLETLKKNISFSKDVNQRDVYHSFFPLTQYQKEEFFLNSIASTNFKKIDYAWISKAGHLIPVGFQGHIEKLDQIREEKLVEKGTPIGERQWVKITTNDYIFCMGNSMTNEQEETLAQFLLAKKDIYFNNYNNKVEIFGFGYAQLENDIVTLVNIYEDKLNGAEYIGSPKSPVKRISLTRAQELHKKEIPLFIYTDAKYQRVKNLDSRYTDNKDIFCHIEDLFK